MSEQHDGSEDNESDNEEESALLEFEHYGLIITTGPEWYEVEDEVYAEAKDRPLLLSKEGGVGCIQFSVNPDDHKSRIRASDLRHYLKDITKGTKMGHGFNLVELKTPAALILACSFRPDDEFHRLWYWTDRKRLVLVSYSCRGEPDQDELRECASMVSRLRVERAET